MLKFNDYIRENNEVDPNMERQVHQFEDGIFETSHGEIRYRLYDDNVLVFMVSHVEKAYRGQGIFKEMLLELLDKFKDKDIYVPISNKKIIDLFLRCGFDVYNKPIRYWGKTGNSINMFKKA